MIQFGLSGFDLPPGQSPGVMAKQIANLGVTHLRPVIRWDQIQISADRWEWLAWEDFFNRLSANGGRAWVVLHTGRATWATNRNYSKAGITPTTNYPPLDYDRYGAFLRALAQHYGALVDVWLIGNEMSEGYSYAGDAASYLRLIETTAAAIRTVKPDATVVLGAIPVFTAATMVLTDRIGDPVQQQWCIDYASRMQGQPLSFDQIYAFLLRPENAYRIDFYRQALSLLPELNGLAGNVGPDLTRGARAADVIWTFADQMREHGGGEKPIYITEANPQLADSQTAGQEFTAFARAAIATGKVSGLAWLQYADSVEYPNIGLVTAALKIKPAYLAYKNLIAEYRSVKKRGGFFT